MIQRRLLAPTALAWLAGCGLEPNYLDPDGPRYGGDYTVGEPTPAGALLVVSYNLEFGREIAAAVLALDTAPLAGADVVVMQEMDADGVDRIAAELGLRYVYYPASVKHDRDWGNAILTRWPLLEDHKVLLPHADPYSNTRRIAVAARVAIGEREVLVYSTHTATPTLGLGARLDQVEAILDDAADVSPALIAGDFNTADPGSAGQTLELLADRGFGWASDEATDTGSAFGLYDVTLDYVFARGLAAGASGVYDGEAGSDHKPIWVELEPP